MPLLNSVHDVEDSLAAPLGDLIAAVGRGVAEAQLALDEAALETLKKIYNPENRSLLAEFGYQPTWYKIPEVDAEIVVSLSIHGHESFNASGTSASASGSRPASSIKLYANPVDAHYTNKYDYNVQAASKVRFKIVPVPPTSQASNLKVVPPDLIGQRYTDAVALLADLGIPHRFAREVSNPEQYRIAYTNPKPGEILADGKTLDVGLELMVVPQELLRMIFRDAKKLLADLDIPFTLDRNFENPDNRTVVETDPKPGEVLPAGQKLKICLTYKCSS